MLRSDFGWNKDSRSSDSGDRERATGIACASDLRPVRSHDDSTVGSVCRRRDRCWGSPTGSANVWRDDLRKRIKATRWPERETVADAYQGVQLVTLQKLAQ